MTDVEVFNPNGAVEHADETPGLAPVSEREFAMILRQADVLAQSAIIPSAYRRQPANIVAAALTGRTFGWDVLTAMRNGHVIEGTWTLKPEAMLALVRRAGHSVNGTTGPDGATVTGKRRDTSDEMTVTFAMADAQRAGLANKGTWKQYPQAMCWARAVSQLCRMLFADVTLGLSYTPEELGADVDAEGEVITTTSSLEPQPESPYISAANVQNITNQCEQAGVAVADLILLATDGRTDDPAGLLKTEVAAARNAKQALEAGDPDALARLASLRAGEDRTAAADEAGTDGRADDGLAAAPPSEDGADPVPAPSSRRRKPKDVPEPVYEPGQEPF